MTKINTKRSKILLEKKCLPRIDIAGSHLIDLIRIAWVIILDANENAPFLFESRGRLVRIVNNDDEPRIAVINRDAIFGILLRVAEWVRIREKNCSPANPPRDIGSDMLVNPHPDLPKLRMVATTPLFGRSGELISESGYNAASGVYLAIKRKLKIPLLPRAISASDVNKARLLIEQDLLGEFPFVSEADRAHAISGLLLPFVRPMISGPTPLLLIEAPTPGSGKSLLANSIAIVATGRTVPAWSFPESEDEVRRSIASELGNGRVMTLIDNLDCTLSKRMIRSATLASVLTACHWADRRVRTSEMVEISNHALWVATGNNPKLSMELARRSVRSRLDAKTEQPWLRDDFRHSHLLDWVASHRENLIYAVFILVENWKAQGSPQSTRLLGSFEDWSRVIGGILASAQIPGFLENLDELYESADCEGEDWREFAPSWWRRYNSSPVRVSQLNELCQSLDLMQSVRGGASRKSQETRLGGALLGARDAVFRGYRVVLRKDGGRHKGKMWALQMCDASEKHASNEAGSSGEVPIKIVD